MNVTTEEMIKSGAYHIAAHTVVGMMHSQIVEDPGIEIAGGKRGRQDTARLKVRRDHRTKDGDIISSMVGHMAALKWCNENVPGYSQDINYFTEESVQSSIDSYDLDNDEGGSVDKSIRLITDGTDLEFTDELMRKIKMYECRTSEILHRSLVWKGITCLAEELYIEGLLSHDEVDAVLIKSGFLEKGEFGSNYIMEAEY
jgi:hypothetical protein